MPVPRIVTFGFRKSHDTEDLEELYEWIKSQNDVSNIQGISSILIKNTDCIKNSEKITRLLLACCLTHVIRISKPKRQHPFPSQEYLETALVFILGQMSQGLQAFDVQERMITVELVESVADHKTFQLAAAVKNGHEIISLLLTVMLPIAEQAVVKERRIVINLIKDILDNQKLMQEPQVVIPIVEAMLTGSKIARELTVKLATQQLGKSLSNLLIYLLDNPEENKEDKTISEFIKGFGIYNVINELHSIDSSIIKPVYPLLALRFKSLDATERLNCLHVVTRILIIDGASNNHPLLQPCLDRSTDVSPEVRLNSIHAMCQLVQIYPKIFNDISNYLHERSSDTDNGVRCELACICTQIMLKDEATFDLLLTLVKLAADKETEIQLEALNGLAQIYKTYLSVHSTLNKSQKTAATSIFNTFMSVFTRTKNFIVRYVTENLVYDNLLPLSVSLSDRMEKLLFFLCHTHDHAIDGFQFMLEGHKQYRAAYLKWVKLSGEDRKVAVVSNFYNMNNHCPVESVRELSMNTIDSVITLDEECNDQFILGLQEEVTESQVDHIISTVMRCAEQLYPSNENDVTQLNQTITSLLKRRMNSESVSVLLNIMKDCLKSPKTAANYGLKPHTFHEKFATVLTALKGPYGHALMDEKVLEPLFSLLSPGQGQDSAAHALNLFISAFSKDSPLEETHPNLAASICNKCEEILFSEFQVMLSTSLIKNIMKYVRVNLPSKKNDLFNNMFELSKNKFEQLPVQSRAPYVSLIGYLTEWISIDQRAALKTIVAKKVIKEMLLKPLPESPDPSVTRLKCKYSNLSANGFCKILGIKTMCNWLYHTQNDDVTSIGNGLRMMDAIITNKGNLLDEKHLSDDDKAAIRLQAGICILKTCTIKEAVNQLTALQIQNICLLLTDENENVRAKFSRKLNKYVVKPEPTCLPTLFVSMFAFAIMDPNESLQRKAMQYIEGYFSYKCSPTEWYELCIFWLLPLLVNAPTLWILPTHTKLEDEVGWPINISKFIQRLRLALWSIIRPMSLPKPRISFARIEYLLPKIKNCANVILSDSKSNIRLWVLCELVLRLMDKFKKSYSALKKRGTETIDVRPVPESLPFQLLELHSDPNFVNNKKYFKFIFKEAIPVLPLTVAVDYGEPNPESPSSLDEDEEQYGPITKIVRIFPGPSSLIP